MATYDGEPQTSENLIMAEPNETIESAAARAVTMAYGKQETVSLRFSGYTIPVHPSLDKQVVAMYWMRMTMGDR